MKEPSFIELLKEENKMKFNSPVKLDCGYEILNENDQCSHVLFLLSGEIEVYKINDNGKVFRLYTIVEGESCVLNLSCVLSDNNYNAFAKALTDLECVLLPRKVFLEVFHAEEALRSYVFDLISNRLIEITAKVEGIVLESIESRLKNWLIEQNQNNIYITHEELANQLGSAREVISRQLKRWENEDKIILHRGKIQILNL